MAQPIDLAKPHRPINVGVILSEYLNNPRETYFLPAAPSLAFVNPSTSRNLAPRSLGRPAYTVAIDKDPANS